MHLGDHVDVVGPALIQPEHRRVAGRPGSGDREGNPLPDRHILGLTRPPDVTLLDKVLHQDLAAGIHDLDLAGRLDLEGLVVAAVLLGCLGHQAHVGHRAHRGRVEGTVGPAVVEHCLVDPGVTAVGDHRESVAWLPVRPPHLTRGADHRRHRGVDDDVAGHVQIGDALVRVDHG